MQDLSQPYAQPVQITGRNSNNAFSYEEREKLHRHAPTLMIPQLRHVEPHQLVPEEGSAIVFEEAEGGELISCTGLAAFLQAEHPVTHAPVTVMDNHNHALYFWLEAWRTGRIPAGIPVVHVDQHKDMRDPGVLLPANALSSATAAFRYVNDVLNVGNFIVPALRENLLSEVIQLDGDGAFENFRAPHEPFILDIDIDVFAEDLAYMDRTRMRCIIAELFARASCITIATSPYFISFAEAQHWISVLLQDAGLLS